MTTTEVSVRRYLFLHSAIMFLLTSFQGYFVFKAQTRSDTIATNYVKVHLNGFVSALWLSAIAASFDYSNSSLSVKKLVASCAIVFAWTQISVTFAMAALNVKVGSWFIGDKAHDVILAAMMFLLTPSALLGSVMWAAGFIGLHDGEKTSETRAATPSSGRKKKAN